MDNLGEYVVIKMIDFQSLPHLEYGSEFLVSKDGLMLLRKDLYEKFSKPFKVHDDWFPVWFFLPMWVNYVAVDANSDTPIMYSQEPEERNGCFYPAFRNGGICKCKPYSLPGSKVIKVKPLSIPRIYKFD
jgi:hypothetical protein